MLHGTVMVTFIHSYIYLQGDDKLVQLNKQWRDMKDRLLHSNCGRCDQEKAIDDMKRVEHYLEELLLVS